ncbi:unnamed protein product [Protopolystoma xenopodis]|uniref:Uncharacterized protein n=1 Tax=Protopolystoma xenopodis TaxID=117903 RepID=A0A3S5ALU9_9PLAT|nr:unnamed protein product [Protopolystoma xenopodis]
MPCDVLCTATCLTHSGEHVVAARSTLAGPTILVWDLPGNQPAREIAYQALSPLVRDAVSYLAISHDDRLVVAGFTNPADEQAYFMVFDLAAHYSVSRGDYFCVLYFNFYGTDIFQSL